MALNSILKIFLPKDRVFYSLFEEVSGTVLEMSVALKAMVNEPDKETRSSMLTNIENLEHKNDETTHKIFTELGRNFITPFDREDIHYLATAMDDVADYIYASAKKINIYNLNPDDIGIKKLADLIEMAVTHIKTAIAGLRNMKNLQEMTAALVKVNSIENQADDVYDMSIERLFQTENDAKELIKKREIYNAMENATDKCEDVVNVIESIIIKYA